MRQVLWLALLGLVLAHPVSAVTCDPATNSAAIAYLRTSCGSLAPCYTNLVDMNDWIDDCKQPTAGSPLLVDVGPGEFVGQYVCMSAGLGFSATNHAGHVTFRGAGREVTRIVNQASPPTGVSTPVLAGNCNDVGFESLSVHGSSYGVAWLDGGSSSWTDVDMSAGPHSLAFGWFELAGDFGPGFNFCSSQTRAVHHFFGSKVSAVVTGSDRGAGYLATCGETWFYGGEIRVTKSDSTAPGAMAAVNAAGRGLFEGFGTLIRADSGAATSGTFNSALTGVGLASVIVGRDIYLSSDTGSGEFHSHGANVVADASAMASSDATALVVGSGAMAHTPGTAFVVKAGSTSGTGTRLANAGMAMSPFLWHADTEPPAARPGGASIASDDGSDLFIETDCGSDGDCDAAGNETHLMVYNAAMCGSDPWFDVVTGRCRGDTTP